MAKVYDGIDDKLAEFMRAQRLFFVGTAPLAANGHVNVSPKGHDTFRILDPHTVAYLDLTGSGIETVAHLRENGRAVIMFCALENAPRIVRLHGRGEVIEPGHPDFGPLCRLFPPFDGVRSVVRIALERVADSCGYGVPRYRYEGERDQLAAWVASKGPEGVRQYRERVNVHSIDRLPGLPSARKA